MIEDTIEIRLTHANSLRLEKRRAFGGRERSLVVPDARGSANAR